MKERHASELLAIPFSELLTSGFRSFNLQSAPRVYRAREMTAQTDSTWLVCECGRSIRCAVGYEGECLGSLRFFDAPRSGEIHGERLTYCPRCGTRLEPRLLVEALSALAAR